MSQFFTSGDQRIGASASASVLPMNIQGWFHLRWTCLISLQSKWLPRVFSNTTVQKQQFFGFQPSLPSNSHIHTWLLETRAIWWRVALGKWRSVIQWGLAHGKTKNSRGIHGTGFAGRVYSQGIFRWKCCLSAAGSVLPVSMPSIWAFQANGQWYECTSKITIVGVTISTNWWHGQEVIETLVSTWIAFALFYLFLFIWLQQVLVVARGIINLCWGMSTLKPWCAGSRCFAVGASGKELLADAGPVRDAGLMPGLGRPPGGALCDPLQSQPTERYGNPLQYSCLENPMDRGAWRATVHGVTESDTTDSVSTYHACRI